MLHGTAEQAPRALTVLSLAALFCVCAGPAAAKGASYDILYLSGSDQAGINSAKTRVAHILGPDVARRLRVARNGKKYGLVYSRHGDLGSAAAVARSHARMLKARGMQAPVPVKAQDWEAAQSAAPAKAPVKAPGKAVPQSKPAVKAAAAAAPPQHSAAPAEQAALPFEARVDQYLKQLRKSGSVKADESTAWAIYDLADNTKLAGINEDMQLQAASLVKPFIALAYFHEVAAGRQQYTDAAKKHMVEMIRDSDNSAADWFMRLLGGPAAVQKLLKQNYGEMLHDLTLVEYIPRNGRTFRNKASVQDYTAFLHALWDEKLPSSAEIKRVMLLPKRNRLCTGLPQDTEVYDKTGTTSRLCGDMGILVARREDGKRFPYIVIGLIQKASSASRYFKWMRNRGDIIRRISAMAYEEMSLRHHFKDFNTLAEEAAPAPGQDKDVAVAAAPESGGIVVLNSASAAAPAVTVQEPPQAQTN